MWWLRCEYGLELDDFHAMWDRQGGRCAMPLCVTPLVVHGPKNRTYHVDHCHETGQVRGILCPACNLCLGGYERVARLGAAEYLKGVMPDAL